MADYCVEIIEHFTLYAHVDADSPKEALKEAEEMYRSGIEFSNARGKVTYHLVESDE